MNAEKLSPFDLETPILEFDTSQDTSIWTLRHAVEGVQIFGGIGSGKTSGSGRSIALKYLSFGFGGLVLTVKPDEKDLWISYCKEAGRLDDLIILGEKSPNRFNFIEYESNSGHSGKTYTENIVQVLKTVISAAHTKDSSGMSNDGFWEKALDMVIFNIIDLCLIAYGKITIQTMYDIAQSLPKDGERAIIVHEEWELYVHQMEIGEKPERELTAFEEAMIAANKNVMEMIQKYMNANVDNIEALMKGMSYPEFLKKKFPTARTYFLLRQFFMESYRSLYEKTRSIIDYTFSEFMYRLLREPAYSLFCQGSSTVVPEDSLKGKIILLDLSVKTTFKVGRDCQILFKYIWQRAMERRNVHENDRPVFLWADEAQNFLHEHDPVYQATARSSRIATVYITQNIPNYLSAMGGKNSQAKVQGFLGTMATKIFHANADIETNRYASDLVGQDYFEKLDKSMTMSKDISRSRSTSILLEKVFRPEDFVKLKGGSLFNNYIVEGIIHKQGDPIFGGNNYQKVGFHQIFIP